MKSFLKVTALVFVLVSMVVVRPGSGMAAQNRLEPAWLKADLDRYWGEVFDDAGLEWEPPAFVFFEPALEANDEPYESGCGDFRGPILIGPLYCPADHTVYNETIDRKWTTGEHETFWVMRVALAWTNAARYEAGLLDDQPADRLVQFSAEDDNYRNWCLTGAYVADAVAHGNMDEDDVLDEMSDGVVGDALRLGYEEGVARCGVDFGGQTGRGGRGATVEADYVSPTYGFGLDYGRDWEVVDESSDDGLDTLALSNGTTMVFVFGTTTNAGNDERCQAQTAGGFGDLDAVEDFEQAETDDGEPLAGADEYGAWSVYTLGWIAEDGDAVPTVAFVNCLVLEPRGSAVEMIALTNMDDFGDAIDPILALREGIIVSGEAEAITEVSIDLAPIDRSGVRGTATLEELDSGNTMISVQLTGRGVSGEEGGYIHEGTCDDIGPVSPESDLIGLDSDDGFGDGPFLGPLRDLLDGEYSLVIHESSDEDSAAVACGEIAA